MKRQIDIAKNFFIEKNMCVDSSSTKKEVKSEINAIADNYPEFNNMIYELGTEELAKGYLKHNAKVMNRDQKRLKLVLQKIEIVSFVLLFTCLLAAFGSIFYLVPVILFIVIIAESELWMKRWGLDEY